MPNIYDGIGGEKLVEEVNNALDLRGGLQSDGNRGGEQIINGAIKATNMLEADGKNFYSYKEDYITKFINSEANIRRDVYGNIIYYADREPVSSYSKYFFWMPSKVYSSGGSKYVNCIVSKIQVDDLLKNSITSLSTFRIGIKNKNYLPNFIQLYRNYYNSSNQVTNIQITNNIKNSLNYYVSSPITISPDIFSDENYDSITNSYKVSFSASSAIPDEFLKDGVALFFNDVYL